MNTLAIAAVAAALWSGSGAAKAQAPCFELPQLLSIATARMSVAQPERIPLLQATEWQLTKPASPTQEILWTSLQLNAQGVAQAQVILRPLPGQLNPDVLLKTNQNACVKQLRSSLKDLGLKPVPVTCPSCEAQRYQATDFVATLYTGLKGDFPFMVVMHPVAVVGSSPSVSRQQ